MYSYGFQQLTQNPTRRNHILDWFLTNKPSFAFSSSVLSPIFNLDHCPIYLDLRFNSPSDYYMVNSSAVWDYSAAYFEGLNSALFSIPWDFIVANSSIIVIALDNITDVINQCAELHIPTKTVRHFRSHDTPWMTNDIKRLIRQRSKVFSRWRKTDDVRCKIKYHKRRNIIQRKIRVANPATEIPSCRNLTPFAQETFSIGNLSTATGIRANPVNSHWSLMEKQFMILMKSVTFLTPIFLAFQRYPMKNSEM